MDVVKNVLEDFGNIMDQDIVAVQLGCYSVAMIGLTAAIRKVRPFSRFKRPKDIPKHFIQEGRELSGYVKRIDPNGALLMIEHKPLISLPIVSRGELPVKILGVKVSGLGISWLQAITVNSEVTFIPVKKESDFVHCEVLLPNTKTVVKKASIKSKEHLALKKLLSKKEEPFLNVGECLVKIGFAEISQLDQPILTENQQHTHYYKSLHSAQLYELKKRLGMKYYMNICTAILNTMLMKSFIYSKDLLLKVANKVQNVSPKIVPT